MKKAILSLALSAIMLSSVSVSAAEDEIPLLFNNRILDIFVLKNVNGEATGTSSIECRFGIVYNISSNQTYARSERTATIVHDFFTLKPLRCQEYKKYKASLLKDGM